MSISKEKYDELSRMNSALFFQSCYKGTLVYANKELRLRAKMNSGSGEYYRFEFTPKLFVYEIDIEDIEET